MLLDPHTGFSGDSKVVWCSHHLKNFPQFVVTQMLAIWSLVPLPFLNPACTSGSSLFTHCWSLAWRILSITLPACERSTIVQEFKHSLALPFIGIGMKTELSQSYGHCWVFQICGHVEYSTLTASSFRIWNNSAEFHHFC